MSGRASPGGRPAPRSRRWSRSGAGPGRASTCRGRGRAPRRGPAGGPRSPPAGRPGRRGPRCRSSTATRTARAVQSLVTDAHGQGRPVVAHGGRHRPAGRRRARAAPPAAAACRPARRRAPEGPHGAARSYRPAPRRLRRARGPGRRSGCGPPAAGPGAGRRPGRDHRRRQHRRRHRAPRPAHQPGPRHRHLHPGRPGQRRDRAGGWPARPGRSWTTLERLGGADLVPPRRPRPGHPPLPDPAAGRGGDADAGHRRDRRAPAGSASGSCPMSDDPVRDPGDPGRARRAGRARSASRSTSCGSRHAVAGARPSASRAPSAPRPGPGRARGHRRGRRRSSSARRTRSSRSARSWPCPGSPTPWPPAATDVVAVSPIVAGAALKGPADRLLTELGHEPSVVGRGPPLRRRGPAPW